MRFAAFFLLAPLLGAQPAAGLNAVAWVRTAAEYRAGAMQAYRAARAALDRARKDKRWTAALEQTGDFRRKPPAVVLDLDETVLDNSAFQAGLVRDGTAYTEAAWERWVAQATAGGVPGALEFLRYAESKKVSPVYVTNRACNPADPQDGTVAVLRRLGAPFSPDRLLCRGADSDKGARRAQVADRYRILLLLGDDFGDFLSVPREQATVQGRRRLQEQYGERWGERWFVIPNPMYGSWERAAEDKLDAIAR